MVYEKVIEENMVIGIEPALYFEDIGEFRHSDTVPVTKNGYEDLAHFPTDPDSLTIRDALQQRN